MSSPLIVLSHKIETLASAFADLLQKDFSKKTVVVPSVEMKNWLLMFLCKKSNEKAVLGIDFIDMQSIDLFFENLFSYEKRIFSRFELSLWIQNAIIDLLEQFEQKKETKVLPLAKFFESEKGKRREKKIVQVSSFLSQFFLEYSKTLDVGKWPQELEWEKILWERLVCEKQFLYPTRDFSLPIQKEKLPAQIHLFSYSNISFIEQELLKRVSDCQCQVIYYLFSPCSYYWPDFLSIHETKAFWKNSLKTINPEIKKEFLDFQSQHHPLLMNLGIMGREMSFLLDEYDHQTLELYAAKKEESLLSRVQKDILEGIKEEKYDFSKDHSIEIRTELSPIHEVEAFTKILVAALQKKTISPREILILLPNVDDYYPFLSSNFDRLNIPYRLMGLSLYKNGSLLKGYFSFFEMVFSENFLEHFFELLKNQSFYHMQGYTQEEVEKLLEWLKRFSSFSSKNILSEIENWIEKCLGVLQGIIVDDQNQSISFGPPPMILADYSSLEFLEKTLSFFSNLKIDLEILQNHLNLSLIECANQFEKILEKYFTVNPENFVEKKSKEALEGWISQNLRENGSINQDLKTTIFSLYLRFEKELKTKKFSLGYEKVDAIKILPLEEGAILSKSWIAIFGLDDDFPRIVMDTALNVLRKNKITATDQDRYLFLKILMNANEKLYLSFSCFSKKDDSVKKESVVIQELLTYLKEQYHFVPQTEGEEEKVYVPDVKENAKKESFFSRMQAWKSKNNLPVEAIDLNELLRFSKNPIRYFMQTTLNLYLPGSSIDSWNDLDFIDQEKMKNHLIHEETEKVFMQYQKVGRMNSPFAKVMMKKNLQREGDKINSELKKFQIKKTDIFKIILQRSCSKLYFLNDTTLVVPAQKIEYEKDKSCVLYGEISLCTRQGLLLHSKKSFNDHIRIWPLELIFHRLDLDNIEKNLLWLKDGRKTPLFSEGRESLEKYLRYFIKARVTPSFFLPSLAESFFSEDFRGIMQKTAMECKKNFPFRDDYLNKMTEGMNEKEWDELFNFWQEDLRELYSPLKEEYAKRI